MPSIPALALSKIPDPLFKLGKALALAGGECYIVGGWVRDAFLDNPGKDIDLEVHGIEAPLLEKVLWQFGKPHFIGKSFGVYHLELSGILYDIALPRQEQKIGHGHKGFTTQTHPYLGFSQAALRRDFTMNAMGIRIPSLELVDPYGGLGDLEKKILRHVSPAFSEDPLRALRAMQMLARFECTLAPETLDLCAQQPLEELPPERLWEEWKKLLLKAKQPSKGLEYLKQTQLLRYFPELERLCGTQQDPLWHPEGDVWVHTLMVLDAAAEIRDKEISSSQADSDYEKLVLMLGALCHDFGKPQTTKFEDGRWRSPGHEPLGEKPTRNFLKRFTKEVRLHEDVVALVRDHLKPALLFKERDRLSDAGIRRLSLRVDIPRLVRVAKADHFGRTTPDALAREFPEGEWLLNRAAQLGVRDSKPLPFLQGRHLLQIGQKPGPHIGSLLDRCFELQLEGKILSLEAALTWVKQEIEKPSALPNSLG